MSEGREAGLIGLAGGFTDLVLHLWAHVRAPGPGNSFDPRYVAWARGCFSATEQARVEQDAAIIGARWHDSLHAWTMLHRDLDELAATVKEALADVRAPQVADAAVLRALQAIDDPVIELAHAALGLLLGPWRSVYSSEVEPAMRRVQPEVESALSLAVAIAPGLVDRSVALSWPLGPRGRAMPDRIVVGAPADWNGQAPIVSAVLALHEHAVLEASSDHFGAEWEALVVTAKRTRDGPAELRRAYDQWLASLDLDAILDARPELSPTVRDALLEDAAGRGERLARLH